MKKLFNDSSFKMILATVLLSFFILGCGSDDPVNEGNHLPDVNIVEQDKTVLTGTTLNLRSVALDVDADALTYLWSFVSKPAGSVATLTTNTTKNTSFIADKAGSYVIKFVAKDVVGGEGEDTITITVNDATVINPNTCTLVDTTNQRISTDTTWTDSCYRVKNKIMIDTGALLTLKEGTVLFFEEDQGIDIRGALKAVGTEEVVDETTGATTSPAKPIIFTGVQKTKGYWTGISFLGSNDNRNEIAHSTIEYATTAFYSGNSDARIKVRDTIFTNSTEYGFYFKSTIIIDQWERVTSVNNKTSGRISVENLKDFTADSNYTGNTNDYLEINAGGNISQDTHVWKKLSVPVYFLSNANLVILEQGFVSVEAGTTFLCASNFEIQVRGALKILGTLNEQVTFKGKQATAGYWDGITFLASNDARNEIAYTNIEDAGSVDGTNYGGAIWIHDDTVRVNIHDSTIKNTIGSGIFFRYNNNPLVTVEDMTYIDIGHNDVDYL